MHALQVLGAASIQSHATLKQLLYVYDTKVSSAASDYTPCRCLATHLLQCIGIPLAAVALLPATPRCALLVALLCRSHSACISVDGASYVHGAHKAAPHVLGDVGRSPSDSGNGGRGAGWRRLVPIPSFRRAAARLVSMCCGLAAVLSIQQRVQLVKRRLSSGGASQGMTTVGRVTCGTCAPRNRW